MSVKEQKEKRLERAEICFNARTKEKLFELMFKLDDLSASRDLVGLRRTHYDNMEWLHKNKMQEEYYQYFIRQIKP